MTPAPLHWAKPGLVVFTIAALSALMSIHLTPDRISLREGERSPREIRATRSVIYVNSVKTAQLQKAAMEGTRPVYDVDLTAAGQARNTVDEIFHQIATERKSLPASPRHSALTARITHLQDNTRARFTRDQLQRLLTMPQPALDALRQVTLRLITEAMEREIRDQADIGRPAEDLNQTRQSVAGAALNALPHGEDAAIVRIIADQALRPNRILNRVATERERQRAANDVPPVLESIVPGERIIAEGELVTREHIDKFTALGLQNPRLELTTGAAVCMLAAAMVMFVAYYISRSMPSLYRDTRRLWLLAVISLLGVFGLKIGATMLGLSFSNGQLGYLGMMSVAAAGMLVSVLIDRHLAVLIVALLAVQSGLIMNHEIRFTVMTLMSSLVGITTVGCVRSRINLLGTTAALAATNTALALLLGMLLGQTRQEIWMGALWAMCAGVFAIFLFWFGVLMLERPFGILTHATLLELGATDRPLLKQLCAVAPGTYAHSMMVGALAEAAAQAIGADALLCRVGGYYHDIGKMKRPDFFVENQRRENVHLRLSPSLSALIITAHVRDGIEMAREHRLPVEIRDIIAQHHGTTLIRYFYHQALADNEGNEEIPPGLEERFRYPGPKPQTRENAIVMLADSVEAAARCLDKPDPERLEALIHSIVRDKIEDGQLDECGLTFRDVRDISHAFLHFLTAMMHGRIDYPQREPRTATGMPMEVVRPDLRPEKVPASTARAMTLSPEEERRMAETGVVSEPDTDMEHIADTGPGSQPRSETAYPFDEPEGFPALSLSRLDLREEQVAAFVPFTENEALHGPDRSELPVTSDTDNPDASGSASPAAGGRETPRRG
ncbi:MAG: HDIG domain-containing protein [Chloroherpetonaceae bacterium]|nr:HDIG domain-containing protein [Chthonomonadaceae bacterium]MDW8206510.1 HDIG domain-containing protein [Chloroherpetonaceae bacterium]